MRAFVFVELASRDLKIGGSLSPHPLLTTVPSHEANHLASNHCTSVCALGQSTDGLIPSCCLFPWVLRVSHLLQDDSTWIVSFLAFGALLVLHPSFWLYVLF